MINHEDNPEYLNSFLDYTMTILNKSPNTVKEYNYDLATFLKFIKIRFNLTKEEDFSKIVIKDIDLKNRIVNIDHQLQRTSDMQYVIESTKTNAGTRKLPITEEVAKCFQAIIEDREPQQREKMIDGYAGFLFYDKDNNPLVAMHWEHRFNHMVQRYNDIYRIQIPNITPHVCRHTYCSNMAKSGMNPKTLQYLMGHSDIGVTLNTYTHLGLEDAEDELKRMENLNNARNELDKNSRRNLITQKMFRVI